VPDPSTLDLVLVNPANRRVIYQSLGENLSAIEPPVWAGLMANFVQRRGFRVAIVDASAEELDPAETAARVAEMKPLLVAVVVYGHQPSASTQVMPGARSVCNAIKERSLKQPILLVGGHVAALPERTLREEAADYVAAGEGLLTLVQLLEALKTPGTDLTRVAGLWYRSDQGEVRNNPAPVLVRNLDEEMPGICWEALPMERYRAHNWHCFGQPGRMPYAAIYTTLGCPYHCSFCCIHAPFKSGESALGCEERVNSYRLWSPATVIAQIDTLVNRYGVRNLKIADELFVLNRRHVIDICDLIIERGYDLNIWAYSRVDTLKDEMIDKLRVAGFRWLALGVESGSECVRRDVNRETRQEDIFTTLNMLRQAGIHVIGNYIFGLPEDDLESMQATLDLALDLNCEFANFYCAMAYPGSALYEAALRKGVPLPTSWSGYSQHSIDTLPLPTRHLSAAEVLRFRDHAFQVYFNHPPYLAMMEEKFGADVVQEIREMTSHQLVRRHN
jgi:anaerobic magnesium-protoporphyrin IX monomethyl ester cyclase